MREHAWSYDHHDRTNIAEYEKDAPAGYKEGLELYKPNPTNMPYELPKPIVLEWCNWTKKADPTKLEAAKKAAAKKAAAAGAAAGKAAAGGAAKAAGAAGTAVKAAGAAGAAAGAAVGPAIDPTVAAEAAKLAYD